MKSNGSTGLLYWYGVDDIPLRTADLATDFEASNAFTYYKFAGKRIGRYWPNQGGENDFYITDHLGNTRFLWTFNGRNASDYYPFGGERPIYTSSLPTSGAS